MSSTSSPTCLSPAEAYRLWASTYDQEANPMLALERRVLASLLPPPNGLDVVDFGCGTGGWLFSLKEAGARSLTGVDASPEMLIRAKSKLNNSANLVLADCTYAPLPAASADLLLCSFVVSYIEDAAALFTAACKILRPGGSLFLTDIHPETAAARRWRRSVRFNNESREIRTFSRSIPELIDLAEGSALKLSLLVEPTFGEAERPIFLQSGKAECLDQITPLPAIFIFQLTSPKPSSIRVGRPSDSDAISRISGAQFALDSETACRAYMGIANSRIESLSAGGTQEITSPTNESAVDLSGYLVLPGLINAHDHLEFALFPRLGRGGYKNFLEWAEDVHQPGASPVVEQRKVPRNVRLWWGGLRNLLCGVTTVCHHNPYDPGIFSEEFPVRVLKEFGWAHSLHLDPDFSLKKRQTPDGLPFFIHLAEGIDQKSADEIFQLARAGALDKKTVVIHGLGLGLQGTALLLSSGAGLVWCPTSNFFLFGKSLTPNDVRAFSNAALGSDSPLTAQGDLLDEVRFARETLSTPPADLYRYVTRNAANLLGLRNGEGQLRIGAVADFVAVRDLSQSPAESLSQLSYRDVELVLLGGRVQLASQEMMHRLPSAARDGLQCIFVEDAPRWVRAPVDHLFTEATMYLGSDLRLGGKRVHRATKN